MASKEIQYVVQENGFWYVAGKERTKTPEITVSSKGIANGLSEEYNDGYDFGPDTYNPSITSGIPLTQTLGIQEAINYITIQGVGKLMLKGQFDITNAPLIEDPNNPGQYCQIYLPYVELNNLAPVGQSLSLGIDCMGNTVLPSYTFPAAKTPINATYIVSNYSGSENMTVFYQMHGPSGNAGGQSNVSLSIGNLIVFSYPKSNINGIDIAAALHVHGKTLVALTSNAFLDTALPTEYGGVGINLNINGYGGTKIFDLVYVEGYNIGLIPNLHTAILKYSTYYVGTGIQVDASASSTSATYLSYIGYYDAQVVGIAVNIIMGKIVIDVLSYGDVITTAGYFYTYQYLIQQLSGNTGSVYINYLLANVTSISDTNAFGTPVINAAFNIKGIFGGKINHSNFSLSATLPANPPVSGKVYQNTNPYDIEIDLPVYATTAGTAGYVTVAKGPSSSPDTIANQYVSGDTASGTEEIIRLRVPAGWYYSFTESGVTFSKAVVFAD